ncbi:actin-related protein 2/3 complex subunit 5-like protein [Molossus molossus]|uniref:actin-related protein 2/3 complex subunit 5-like protein n=1 Tax=Molossus molossus TaxID=27622 RepID=UPI001746F554|nr:actin-related protein 2/3 complex subunit 5-like protein [Molossus molossus]
MVVVAAGKPGWDLGEVVRLLQQGNILRAFHAALWKLSPPHQESSSEGMSPGCGAESIKNFKNSEIEQAEQSLDKYGIDLLMKSIYKGFDKPKGNSSVVLLQWHKNTSAAGGLGSIIRIL